MIDDFGGEIFLQKVYNYIKKRGNVSRSELLRSFSHRLTSKDLNEIINTLANAKMVGERVQQTHAVRGRKSRTIYFPLPIVLETHGSQILGNRPEEKTIVDRIPGPRLHEKLANYLCEVGEMLKKYPQKEYRKSPYIYDVIWREFAESPRASHVFEVQDKGDLIQALAKLQHARDIWGSKLFLVVTGEKDRYKLPQLVGSLLKGTFHRLSQDMIVLSQEDTERLYEALNKEKELLRHLLT